MSTTEPWRNPPPAPNVEEVRQRASSKDTTGAWLRSWWPALAWAAIIFILSTDAFSLEHTSRFISPILHWLFPSASPERIYLLHHLIRKAAHFVEYFVFFVFIYRGIRRSRGRWHWSWALGAWLIAAAYSVLDEFHQVFVPSRGPSVWDSLLDSAGALIALLTLFILYRRFQRTRAS